METTAENVVLLHHFRVFLMEAHRRGIDVAPLKGAHLLTSVYDADTSRGFMADVDFLVRPEDWNRVLDLLSSLGFERGEDPGRPVSHDEFYEACYFLRVTDNARILFEPHRYLVQRERHNIDYDALWKRSAESIFDGAPCRRLSSEDHVLHTAIHLMTDSFIRPSKSLGDLERLLTAGGADLDVVLLRAKSWECERATWLALKLLDEKRPDLKIGGRISKLQVPAAARAALEILIPGQRGFVFPGLGLRARQGVLFPLLLDGPGPLIRFTFYYGRLRLKDLMESLRRKYGGSCTTS